MKNECAVVIKSTDSFSDCWPATLECLKRFWPDCPYPVFTTSEKIPWGERPVMTGENRGWCRNLENVLDQIDAKIVLLTQEDLLFCAPVNTYLVELALAKMQLTQIVPAQIILGPGPQTIDQKFGDFGSIDRHSPYSISCTPTFWRTDWLREVLSWTDNPWQFEMDGTKNVRKHPKLPPIWAAGPEEEKRPIKVVYSAITRGKWEASAIAWLKKFGVEVDSTRRGIKS